MRLGNIVLLLRLAETRFKNRVAGAAELDIALKNPLKAEAAFCVPLNDIADRHSMDLGINQKITERFGVVVAITNDTSQADKLGLIANDQLHDTRSELFRALVGLELNDTEGSISYVGGSLLQLTRAYLWYQFEFEVPSRIITDSEGTCDLQGRVVDDRLQRSQLPDFDTIYANYILSPSAELPYDEDLPLVDGFPDVQLPNMAQWIDLTDDPREGAFAVGFGQGFDLIKSNFSFD